MGIPTGMKDGIVLASLEEGRILQAYPLVREVAPDIAMEAWRDYARGVLVDSSNLREEEQGIIAAWAQNRYLRGLFVYRMLPDVQCGRVLAAEFFVGGSPFRQELLADRLLTGAETLARKLSCKAVHAGLPTHPDWLAEHLAERGYREHSRSLCRPLKVSATAR